MEDKRRSFRSQHNASRHTMVMQKAREEDARRVAASDSARAETELSDDTRTIRPPQPKTFRVPGEKAPPPREPSERRVSGRSVTIHRPGEGRKGLTVATGRAGGPASVRVTGGDTIIRYQSGDMVVMRGTRRAELRKQIIWAYALGYLILFATFGYFLLTGTTTMKPEEYLERAFSKRKGESVMDLERAAYEAMRGSRTPAEVRLAEPLTFHDENKDTINVASGDRLTLLTAAKLGQAIIEDQRLPESRRTFAKPFRLYKETYLANMRWPFWLTLYNSLGFFLLLLLFLWRPIREFLGTQAKKTAVALRNSREAQDAAQELRQRYRDLANDIDVRRATLREQAEADAAAEREAALENATRRAQGIAGEVQTTLQVETDKVAKLLGGEASRAAIRQARGILTERLGQREHDIAIEELIADIATTRPA